MSTVLEIPSNVITAPTYRAQCERENLRLIAGPEVPTVPPAVSIAFPVLLTLVLILDRRLLNKLDKTKKSKLTAIVVLVIFLGLPSILDALFSLLETARVFKDNHDILNNLFECLNDIIPNSINRLIPELFVVVSGLAASIGVLSVIVFGVFEDYKKPELYLKKRRVVFGVITLIVSTLLGAFILIRVRFSGFGCTYDKEFDRYFCYTRDTADGIKSFYGFTLESLKVCDRANAFVQGSISQSSVPPSCLKDTVAAGIQDHFQTVVHNGVSNVFSAASIAVGVFCSLSLLANLSFIVYRLWRKADLGMPWMIIALFMVGLSNSTTVYLIMLRHFYTLDRVRVVACGCAVEKADLDWEDLVRQVSGMIMAFSVVISYSKLELRPNEARTGV